MQLVIDIGTAILTTYLALTNTLATQVLQFEPSSATQAPAVSSLKQLESSYQFIPDILLTNADFQQANVGSAVGIDSPRYTPAEATVNIFCTYTTADYVKTTTGSGFFISANGAILTNAHVAQFLLLERSKREGETDCVIRTGTPATAAYEAELLYLPPAWISEHAKLIDVAVPKGTGERDYALLYASASLTDEPMPGRFPHLRPDPSAFSLRDRGTALIISGYPAQPLYEEGAEAALVQQNAQAELSDIFTFANDTADLLSISDSAASAGGISGGPVTNERGDAVAVAVTRGETEADSLRALTINYIDRTIREETGFGLTAYISGDLSVRAAVFESALAPFLRQLLEFELGV